MFAATVAVGAYFAYRAATAPQPSALSQCAPKTSIAAADAGESSQHAGRVVFITGASSGIGREVAVKFARAKCNLALHYGKNWAGIEETASLCKAEGAACIRTYSSNLNSVEGSNVQELVDAVVADFGAIHGKHDARSSRREVRDWRHFASVLLWAFHAKIAKLTLCGCAVVALLQLAAGLMKLLVTLTASNHCQSQVSTAPAASCR